MGKLKTTKEYIKELKDVYGDLYDYSLVKYNGSHNNITLICPIHGGFKKRADRLLNGNGCQKCKLLKTSDNNSKKHKQYLLELKDVYGDLYDYSLVEYNRWDDNIILICPKHGKFKKRASKLLDGCGCQMCNKERVDNEQCKSINDVISDFKNIHGDLYDYSLVEYINTYTTVKIICKKHGVFEQRPRDHIRGSGCPICKNSLGENKILKIFKDSKINYETQKVFDGCVYVYPLKFDFYLPDINMCIEYDGKQHYESIKLFGGDEGLKKTQIRDNIKNKYCEDNNINLLRIPYYDNKKIDVILKGILKRFKDKK